MRICIIGAKGFVGGSLYKYLQSNHEVIPVTRDNLDVLSSLEVQKFIEKYQFDVIVNAAATMQDNNSLFDTRNNLGLFMNFHRCRQSFGKFINLGSGAEFDRSHDINNAEPYKIFQVLPQDSYGFGQNMKSRICFETDNFFTIRIFNCFGLGEISSRIFPKFLNDNKNFTITNDRYFDYFGIRDLCTVVHDCIVNNWTIKDVNATYKNKYKISQVLEKFCQLNNIPINFNILSQSRNNYTGSATDLYTLAINLRELEYELQHYKDPL